MPDPTRRNEVVPCTAARVIALSDEIATREQALKKLLQRTQGKRLGARSTTRQIIAASEAVIADLIAERDRLARQLEAEPVGRGWEPAGNLTSRIAARGGSPGDRRAG